MTKMPFASDIKIIDVLKQGKFTLSAEIIPPRNGSNQQQVLTEIKSLVDAGSDFLAVTKGAGGSLRGGSLPIAQVVKDAFGLPVIAHFTCRDLTREEIENQLVDHHLFGIRNVLALRGDPPVGQPEWEAGKSAYPYAYMLIEQIIHLNQGKYIHRPGMQNEAQRELQPTDFCIGAAAYPDEPDPVRRIDHFIQKVKAGAQFGITQMMFSVQSYERFCKDLAERGVHIPILPGTRVLKSKKQAARVCERFGVPIPESYLQALPEEHISGLPIQEDPAFVAMQKLIQDFRSAGAPGFHAFVLSDAPMISQLFRAQRGARP